MENTILQLIKIITALYFNSIAEDENNQMFEEIQSILKEIKVDPRAGSGVGSEDVIIESLRYTAEWMVYNGNTTYSKPDLLQRLTVNVQGDMDHIAIISQLLTDDITVVDARRRVNTIMQELRYDKKRSKIKSLIAKANARINFSGEYVEMAPFVNELTTELATLSSSSSKDISGLIGKVDFTDDSSIENALTKGIELVNEQGVLNTGLQGLNAALGVGGAPRGALVDFGGLTHNYKSGMLNDLCILIPMFNDPWMWDASKKPLIIKVSFENTTDQDTLIMYKKLFEVKNGTKCNTSNINIAEATAFLKDYFQQRGYTFQLLNYDALNFTVYDLFNILNDYIDQGFEIHAVICDYLSQIAGNTIADRVDSRITKTFEMVRIFCYPKGITFFTAHQLSTEAQKLCRENPATFTKVVSTGGWYMDCQSLHTKLDIEFVMHIVKHIDGFSYLTISRGKNRFSSDTPEKYKHFMYKFEEVGGIVPDIGGESKALYALPKMLDSSDSIINWD